MWLSSPPSWTEELARYMMVWAGLLGTTMSFKSRSDPALFSDPSQGRGRGWRIAVGLLQSIAALCFLVPVIVYSVVGVNLSVRLGFLARQARLSADTLGFPMVWVVAAVPLAALIIVVHLAARATSPSPAPDSAEIPG
ncbi:MAG: TRAP transporter small permease subunit [Burkholderiaceae bacterium]